MKFRPCIDIHNGNVKQIVAEAFLTKTIMLWITSFQNMTELIMAIFISHTN